MSISMHLSQPLRKLLDEWPQLMIHSIEFTEAGVPTISIMDRSTGIVEGLDVWLSNDCMVDIDGEAPQLIASRNVTTFAAWLPDSYEEMIARHKRQGIHVPTLAELESDQDDSPEP